MGTSRDENDPRDLMRAMRKEARAEFEGEEADDTGGRLRARQDALDRRGVPAEERPVEAATRDMTEATRAQDDSDALRVPRADPTTGGGGDAAGGPPAEPASTPTGG